LGEIKKRDQERNFVTFRLLKADRDLLRYLGRGPELEEDRHEALLALVPIVEALDMPVIKKSERKPLRFGIPKKLDTAIRKVTDETDQKFIGVLLEAARIYREQNGPVVICEKSNESDSQE